MNAPKVTVGIPTFNRSAWLRDTIESVLAQTFTSFRLVVSDNASEDDTPDVVRSIGDERIDYVRAETNVGRIGNFNRLIALADTEYLVLLPDDDVLYPGHLEAAVDALERFDSVGLAHSAFDLIDAQSRVIRRVDPLETRSPVTVETRDQALERLMASAWPICFSSVVYRTKAIVEAGGLREEDEPWGDLQMWMRIALDWDFGYIAKPLAGFRDHAESATVGITADQAETPGGNEVAFRHAEIRFQRRMSFVGHAPLDPRKANWLRALATLELLREHTIVGMPSREFVARLVDLVRNYPRIALRPTLWRLVARRVRSGLRSD
jgi:glycosyltransferase involved in cell wall biosynthesis